MSRPMIESSDTLPSGLREREMFSSSTCGLRSENAAASRLPLNRITGTMRNDLNTGHGWPARTVTIGSRWLNRRSAAVLFALVRGLRHGDKTVPDGRPLPFRHGDSTQEMRRGRRSVTWAWTMAAVFLLVGGCQHDNGRPRGNEVGRCGESWWEGAGRDGTPCPAGYVLADELLLATLATDGVGPSANGVRPVVN